MESSCNKKSDETEPVIEDTTSYYPQYRTPLENLSATEYLVVYEVNIRAFSTTGNIQGVIAKLNHIESLGVNVIWLMPIHPIGQVNSVNSPYSVKDYKAVSSEYGSLEDLRELTTKAHEKGMTVMLDWVANHIAWDNP
jgi:glycosidase